MFAEPIPTGLETPFGYGVSPFESADEFVRGYRRCQAERNLFPSIYNAICSFVSDSLPEGGPFSSLSLNDLGTQILAYNGLAISWVWRGAKIEIFSPLGNEGRKREVNIGKVV